MSGGRQFTTEMIGARTHVIVAAGPDPMDVEHPFNVSLGHLMRALNRNCAVWGDDLLPLCRMLCMVVEHAGRPPEYRRQYAASLALLCISLEVLPPSAMDELPLLLEVAR